MERFNSGLSGHEYHDKTAKYQKSVAYGVGYRITHRGHCRLHRILYSSERGGCDTAACHTPEIDRRMKFKYLGSQEYSYKKRNCRGNRTREKKLPSYLLKAGNECWSG